MKVVEQVESAAFSQVVPARVHGADQSSEYMQSLCTAGQCTWVWAYQDATPVAPWGGGASLPA